jgi:hypothetical protein
MIKYVGYMYPTNTWLRHTRKSYAALISHEQCLVSSLRNFNIYITFLFLSRRTRVLAPTLNANYDFTLGFTNFVILPLFFENEGSVCPLFDSVTVIL